jgi:hypothetical protein
VEVADNNQAEEDKEHSNAVGSEIVIAQLHDQCLQQMDDAAEAKAR